MSPRRPSTHRRRRLAAIAGALVAVLLLGSGAAAAAVRHGQQTDLSAARTDRAQALATLDAAVSRAQAGGIDRVDLGTVLDRRAAILAEAAVPSAPFGFDAGERSHLARQAAALRLLVGRVDQLQQEFTDFSRALAGVTLDQLQSALAAAQKAGLDTGDTAAVLAVARQSVAAASTPHGVDAAMAGIGDRIADVQSRTAAKLAADAALAAAQGAATAALARADTLAGAAQQIAVLQPTVAPWLATIAAEHEAFTKATTVAAYRAVASATAAVTTPLSALLSARSDAYGAMASARQTVQDAITYKVDPGTIPAQLDAIQATLDQAATTPQLQGIKAQLDTLMGPLRDKVFVASLGVGKVIIISLHDQNLVAYQDGREVQRSLVTTGRPALPTPPGHYTVLRKNHPWQMVSDFPRSSPYWYAPTWVQWTLWFRDDGYAIHDAPWRSSYGPGTEQYGSHGCVNVPATPMQWLYNWADVGTRVVVR